MNAFHNDRSSFQAQQQPQSGVDGPYNQYRSQTIDNNPTVQDSAKLKQIREDIPKNIERMFETFHQSPHGDFRPTFYNPFEVKHRRRTTKAQFKVLERVFQENAKPPAALRRQLAGRLGMTPRAVQVWFQNRRAKLKTQQQQQPGQSGDDQKPTLSRSASNSDLSLKTNHSAQPSPNMDCLSADDECDMMRMMEGLYSKIEEESGYGRDHNVAVSGEEDQGGLGKTRPRANSCPMVVRQPANTDPNLPFRQLQDALFGGIQLHQGVISNQGIAPHGAIPRGIMSQEIMSQPTIVHPLQVCKTVRSKSMVAPPYSNMIMMDPILEEDHQNHNFAQTIFFPQCQQSIHRPAEKEEFDYNSLLLGEGADEDDDLDEDSGQQSNWLFYPTHHHHINHLDHSKAKLAPPDAFLMSFVDDGVGDDL